jgi:hypothetical protein
MRLVNTAAEVETQGVSDQSQFSIKMNAKAFRVLSDTLYQNKIGSIVREICCNAMDSHIAANKRDVPFAIHLPDRFEPWFSVIDYGVGMSRDGVRKIYTTYFESTKDESNDMVGAFGLGSKTPFAYTDAFTVTSIFNGERTVYSAYIAQNGMPTIAELTSTKTDEPNGAEIQVPVSDSDIFAFHKEVKEQLRFFKVKPTLRNGNVDWLTLPENHIYKSDFCEVYPNEWGSSTISGIWITQGQVGYPVDNTQIANKLHKDGNSDLRDFYNTLSRFGVVLNFAIGEIEVTASREGIQYTAYTINSIKNNIKRVMDELEDYVQDRLSAFTTVWQKIKYISASGDFFTHQAGKTLDLAPAHRGYGGNYTFSLSDYCMKNSYSIGKPVDSRRSDKITIQGLYIPSIPTDFNTILVRDTADAPMARLQEFISSGKNINNYIVIQTNAGGAITGTFDEQAIRDQFGGFDGDILYISAMERPERAPRVARGQYPKTKFFQYNRTHGMECNTNGSCWGRETEGSLSDFDKEDVIIIPFFRNEIQTHANVIERFNALRILDKFEFGDSIIIAVQQKVYDRLMKDEYTTFESVVNECFDSQKDEIKQGIRRAIGYRNAFYSLSDYKLIKFFADAGNSDAQRIINMREKYLEKLGESHAMMQVASAFGISSDFTKAFAEKCMDNVVARLKAKYPLITAIDGIYYSQSFFAKSSNIEIARAYMELIDRNN